MYEDLVNNFYPFAKKQLGFDKDPKINFVEDDENAQNPMGYTGHYDPSSMVITIYITGRHPKDILRSLSHELVHHSQNCRGENLSFQTHDIDADPHLKAMEDEAFHVGSGRLMKKFQEQIGGYPMAEETSKPDYLDLDQDGNLKEPMKKAAKEAKEDKEDKEKKETQTESKDYHTKKNFMLHDMLLRKFGIKKGDK